MTAQDDRSLLDAFEHVFGPVPYRLPSDAATFEDEDTLLRSRGLSKSARRVQRGPVPLRVDEHGMDRRGRYYPQHDGGSAA